MKITRLFQTLYISRLQTLTLGKLKAYHLQEEGMDTVDANIKLGFKPDERNYGIGAQILRKIRANKQFTTRFII